MSTDSIGAQPQDPLAALARLGETRTWEPGAVVVRQGEAADCMYIVHTGELRALIEAEGGRTVELDSLRAGEFFGELMLSAEHRSATVQVTARAQLTRVTRDEVQRMLTQQPELALQLITSLAHRVRMLTTTVGRMASIDVYGRLVGLFDALAVQDPGSERRHIPGPMSQARIAERLGASRAMVNRLLQDLVRGGYVELTRERIVLLKRLPPRW
jgi:CRP/FNR family cyclic AMP-dependent transcriptional regulator